MAPHRDPRAQRRRAASPISCARARPMRAVPEAHEDAADVLVSPSRSTSCTSSSNEAPFDDRPSSPVGGCLRARRRTDRAPAMAGPPRGSSAVEPDEEAARWRRRTRRTEGEQQRASPAAAAARRGAEASETVRVGAAWARARRVDAAVGEVGVAGAAAVAAARRRLGARLHVRRGRCPRGSGRRCPCRRAARSRDRRSPTRVSATPSSAGRYDGFTASARW